MNIYTIGHSTHDKSMFMQMLRTAEINVLADVRAFPASRKFPQFIQENLKVWLPKEGVEYKHFPLLGGRRHKSEYVQEELNNAWNNPSFHNYADYTLTKKFQQGIDELEKVAKHNQIAICCSERHPARCHRLLISNWLEANGWKVYHLIEQGRKVYIERHELGKWGAMPIIEKDGTVVYPNTK